MFKIIGSLMVVFSASFMFSQKTLVYFFTYRFIKENINIIEKIMYEKNTNLTYNKIFQKIGFDKNKYLLKSEKNLYIDKQVFEYVKTFYENLGKRDSVSENQYFEYHIKELNRNQHDYYKKYIENRKINLIYGISIGSFVAIYLI